MALLLLVARAAAINAGGFPFGSMLPFWPIPDAANDGAAKGVAAKADAAKAGSPVPVAKKKAPTAAGKPASKSAAQPHSGLDDPPKAATHIDDKARLVASVPKVSESPTKLANVSKLIERKDALLRSSSVALENYATALADAQATGEAQLKVKRSEERAEAAVEDELAKLHDAKMKRMEETKKELKSSPLEASYQANQKHMQQIDGQIAAAEGRVDTVNRKATTLEDQVEDATSRLEQSWGEKDKYRKQVEAALREAEELAALLQAAEERHESQMQALDLHAKELVSEDAALLAAINDAKTAGKGSTAAHLATNANKDSHSVKALAALAGMQPSAAAAPPKSNTASLAAMRPSDPLVAAEGAQVTAPGAEGGAAA